MPSKERYIKAQQRAERMAAAQEYLKTNFRRATIDEMARHLGVHKRDGSCVPLVLSVATLCESGKAERQAAKPSAFCVLLK